MSAAEFDAATPREVQWRLEALGQRRERDWQQTAQLGSWMFATVGVKVSANKLLGKPEPFDIKAFIA